MLRLFLFFLGLHYQSTIPTSSVFLPPTECKRLPVFVQKIGFDVQRTGFSTSERKQKGLVFVEFSADGNPEKNRSYQAPSWKQAGAMGPIVLDEEGNVFCAPVPMINVLDNPPELQNILYKVESRTSEMRSFLDLPTETAISFTKNPAQNPFGLLGLAYDCDTKTIYATSVKGSSLYEEVGCVWAIRKSDKTVISSVKKIDAMGVGIGIINNQKRLFIGKTRTGDIVSYPLNGDGSIDANKPQLEISLDNLGARGDDRARKIRFNAQNEMVVQGVEFYYNLIAPTEKQETSYVFSYNQMAQRWVFVRLGT